MRAHKHMDSRSKPAQRKPMSALCQHQEAWHSPCGVKGWGTCTTHARQACSASWHAAKGASLACQRGCSSSSCWVSTSKAQHAEPVDHVAEVGSWGASSSIGCCRRCGRSSSSLGVDACQEGGCECWVHHHVGVSKGARQEARSKAWEATQQGCVVGVLARVTAGAAAPVVGWWVCAVGAEGKV